MSAEGWVSPVVIGGSVVWQPLVLSCQYQWHSLGEVILHWNARAQSCNKINSGYGVSDVTTELEWECFLKTNLSVIELHTKQRAMMRRERNPSEIMDRQVEAYDMAGWNRGRQIFWLWLVFFLMGCSVLGMSARQQHTWEPCAVWNGLFACWWMWEMSSCYVDWRTLIVKNKCVSMLREKSPRL